MKKILFILLRYSGLPYFFREWKQKKKVSILMFHDIGGATADRAFQYLSKNYNLISLKQFLEALEKKDAGLLPPKAMIITFDDGHKRNIELLSASKKYEVPITIFLCSSIAGTNRHFWFKHSHPEWTTQALKKKPNQERLALLAAAGFKQEKEFPLPQALSKKQIEAMAKFVDFQSHTKFHPCLTQCTEEEAYEEISASKEYLEQYFQLPIYGIAYPNGDYSSREINYSKAAGYKCGLTVAFGYNSIESDPFALKRIDTNDTSDINELIVRSCGLWDTIKKWFH